MNDVEAKLDAAREQFRSDPVTFWKCLAEKNQSNTDKALVLIRELRESNAELVQFAREEHNKMQARIREFEEFADYRTVIELNDLIDELQGRIAKAQAILKKSLEIEGGHAATNHFECDLRDALAALEGE